MGSFGETNWVRNLRAAGEATVETDRREERLRAVELEPRDAAPVLRRALARFLARRMLAPMLRRWYGLGAASTDADYLEQAARHPMFELLPLDTSQPIDHQPERSAA
jgi:hypothetical protein